MSFASLGLSEALVRAIEAAGYTEPTPVQQRAIPAVLQGRDLMVAAQTGTGKTGGFALPILERLFPNGHPDKSQRHGPRQPRVLVDLAACDADVVTIGGRQLTVMVADDDPVARELICQIILEDEMLHLVGVAENADGLTP